MWAVDTDVWQIRLAGAPGKLTALPGIINITYHRKYHFNTIMPKQGDYFSY